MRERGVLGILTNDPEPVFQQNVIAGAVEIARRRGYSAEVQAADKGVAHLNALPFDAKALSGLLVIANVASDDVLVSLREFGVAVSLVSHYVPTTGIPAIIPDNREGIAQLVQHLIVDCGRRRLVFIQGDMGQNDGVTRDQAFRQEMMRHNLSPAEAIILRGDFIPGTAAGRVSELLGTNRDFDAILASDYLMAAAALDVVQNAGMSVPDDVCIAGFGDGPEAAAADLTTVAADVVELGRRACRQLIGQIDGLAIRGITVLSTELVPRGTTVVREPQP